MLTHATQWHVIPSMNKRQKMEEHEKRIVTIDFYKHIATLSVACIAVIVTFLLQLKELEQSKYTLLLAVICFLGGVVGTFISSFIVLENIEDMVAIYGTWKNSVLRFSAISVFAAFLAGIGSLSWLIVFNLA